MIFAGLSEEWEDPESGKLWRSFTIVTTVGNELLSQIHNNPKLKGPRMPLILDRENQKTWLEDWEVNPEDRLEHLKNNIMIEDLKAHPVAPIRGKKALGNVAEALVKYNYPELSEDPANDSPQMELF